MRGQSAVANDYLEPCNVIGPSDAPSYLSAFTAIWKEAAASCLGRFTRLALRTVAAPRDSETSATVRRGPAHPAQCGGD